MLYKRCIDRVGKSVCQLPTATKGQPGSTSTRPGRIPAGMHEVRSTVSSRYLGFCPVTHLDPLSLTAMRHLTSLLILILPFVAAAQNLSFPLHHRFVPSSSADAGETRWSHRGTVFVDLDSGTGRFEEASGTGGAVLLVGDEGEWYQVGLGESTGEDGIWPMSSTRAVSDSMPCAISIPSESPKCLRCASLWLLRCFCWCSAGALLVLALPSVLSDLPFARSSPISPTYLPPGFDVYPSEL